MPKRILTLLVALSFLSAPVKATTLFAGISHSESLQPLQTRQPYGAPESPSFDRSNAPDQNLQEPVQVKWIKLPTWMAGTWTKKGDLTVSVTDLRSGVSTPSNEFTEDVMTITWGHLVDAQGNIWHAFLLPSEREGASRGNRVIFKAMEMTAEATTTQYVISRVRYIVSEFDRRGTMLSRFQQETLNRFVLNGRFLENESSNRVFTYEGQPVKEGSLISRFNKDADFKPIHELNGINLDESFAQFISQSQGFNKDGQR